MDIMNGELQIVLQVTQLDTGEQNVADTTVNHITSSPQLVLHSH